MSDILCELVGPFVVQCHGATLDVVREIHGLRPGDLLLYVPGVMGSAVRLRAEDRLDLARLIAPLGVRFVAAGDPV